MQARGRALDQREGEARAAARKPADLAEMQRAGFLRDSLIEGASLDAIETTFEDAVTNSRLAVDAVGPVAVAQLEARYKALQETQRNGQEGVALLGAIDRLKVKLAEFQKQHPSPAETLRGIEQERRKVAMLAEVDFNQIKQAYGLGSRSGGSLGAYR